MQWLKALLRGQARRSTSVEDGIRIFAVGDLHGRLDLLEKLAAEIKTDLQGAPCDRALAVFLGDYIDRGPASSGVLDFLSGGGTPIEAVYLRGNHEEMCLRALRSPAEGEVWMRNGGLETLYSYGLDVTSARTGPRMAEAITEFATLIPREHLAFLERTKLSYGSGDYFFCHAGVKPKRPLSQQLAQDLMWIREEFTDSTVLHERLIVHGHTPVSEPDVRSNRINIDTGAYITGELTCLVLEGGERSFITVTRSGASRREQA